MKRVIKTRPIGDVFIQDGKEYEVIECDQDCLACDMYDGAPDDACTGDIEVCGLCYKSMRNDDKSVVFKLRNHGKAGSSIEK